MARDMTFERWRRTEEIFHAVVALPPGQRAAFLSEASGDDEALRLEVESLLNEPSGDGFLEGAAVVDAGKLAPASMLGRTLAGYHLQALIGAGGMGEVYRAHDSSLGRDVAIKILPPQMSLDQDRLQRFEQEARATSVLNHPNILAIFD